VGRRLIIASIFNLNVEELRRKDPEGYYVIVTGKDELSKLKEFEKCEIIEAGMHLVVRTRSRSIAKRILRKLGRV